MTFNEFKQIAISMRTIYPRENFLSTPDALKMWFSLLQDLPYEAVSIAVKKHMLTSKYLPTVADIRKLATEVKVNNDWGYGWEQVRKAIRKYGIYDPKGAIESLDGITRQVVERIGWNELCLSENQEVDRANFRMLHEQLSNHEEEVNLLPVSLQQELARLLEG